MTQKAQTMQHDAKDFLDVESGFKDVTDTGLNDKEEDEDDEEEGFDALYIKRLLNLFKEKNIPLSVAQAQQKRSKKPMSPKKGQELLLSTTVGNARYQLSERFKSVETPKYYN